jgi:cytochrome b561
MPHQKSPGLPGYGSFAKVLHWSITVLIAVQFAIGWSMPHIGRNTRPDTLINLHFSFGMLILLIVIVRLAWRLKHPVSLLTANTPLWQQRAAGAGHLLLYALLLAIPVLGWLSASGRNFPVNLFGLVEFPALLRPKHPWTGTLGDIHMVLSNYILLGVVAMHGLFALYHHFILHDDTLRRMLPRFR